MEAFCLKMSLSHETDAYENFAHVKTCYMHLRSDLLRVMNIAAWLVVVCASLMV